jgi:hypothetical protein
VLSQLLGDGGVGGTLLDAVDLECGGVEIQGLDVVVTAGRLYQQLLQ